MSFFTSNHFDLVTFIVGLSIGMLFGMGAIAKLIGDYGCYQGCHLQSTASDENPELVGAFNRPYVDQVNNPSNRDQPSPDTRCRNARF